MTVQAANDSDVAWPTAPRAARTASMAAAQLLPAEDGEATADVMQWLRDDSHLRPVAPPVG